MALRALTSGAVSEYRPNFEVAHLAELKDKDPEAGATYESDEMTVFQLRVISAAEAARLETLLIGAANPFGQVSGSRFGESVLWALRCGLVGWVNVMSDGRPVRFIGRTDDDGVCVGADEKDIDRLPNDLRVELWEEIRRVSKLVVRDFR